MFSERTRIEHEPNALTLAVLRARASGRQLLDLTVSNPTQVGLVYPEAELSSALGRACAGSYAATPAGDPQARSAIEALYRLRGYDVASERVVLVASTSEAYSYLFKLLCEPGDEVLVPEPSYPLLEVIARLEEVRITRYQLRYTGDWHIDVDSLHRARTERTRAVVVINPNNPTGQYMSQADLEAISALGLPIIGDEVFFEYAWRPELPRVSILGESAQLVFALDGVSKLIGLPQLKLGWIAVSGPASLRKEALRRLEWIADAFLSPNQIAQLALPELLAQRSRTVAVISQRCKDNRLSLERLLRDSAVSWLYAEAGWYAVLRLPDTQGEEDWVVDLVERDGVLTHPGWFYDFATEPHLVVSLLVHPSSFQQGIKRLVRRVDAHLGAVQTNR